MTTYLGKSCFILFAASAFRKLSSIYVFSYFPFGFEGRIWDLIVSVPDHCLSFYLGIGITVASFQDLGIFPVFQISLKISRSIKRVETGRCFNN